MDARKVKPYQKGVILNDLLTLWLYDTKIKEFKYVPSSYTPPTGLKEGQKVALLKELESEGAFKIVRLEEISEPIEHTICIVRVNGEKLEELKEHYYKLTEDSQDSKSRIDLIECHLRLHDVQLLLKIGDWPELQIASMRVGSNPYRLFKNLLRDSGTSLGRYDIFERVSTVGLWQTVTTNNLGYLRPFFSYSKDRMTIYATKELGSLQVVSLISKINDKYRKDFEPILKELE